ncbi:phosphatase [Fulvimarina sp. MAC8]|uniref:phosphatase n=1 Tax=Fulvimarina sp. MAC8 TaxID=3162874 RepID=UPI0032EFB75C
MPALNTSLIEDHEALEEADETTAAGEQSLRFSAALLVRGQSEARRKFAELAATHVISLKLPGHSYLGPRGLPPEQQLFVSFDDVDDLRAPNAPDAAMVERILAFARTVPEDGKLLVHGLLGVRRSAAVALGLLADRLPPTEAAQALTPLCTQPPDPHPLVLKLFDEALELNGALCEAAAMRFVQGRGAIRRRVSGY